MVAIIRAAGARASSARRRDVGAPGRKSDPLLVLRNDEVSAGRNSSGKVRRHRRIIRRPCGRSSGREPECRHATKRRNLARATGGRIATVRARTNAFVSSSEEARWHAASAASYLAFVVDLGGGRCAPW